MEGVLWGIASFLTLLTGILVMFSGWVSVILAIPKTKRSTEPSSAGLTQHRKVAGIRIGMFVTIEAAVLIYRGWGAGWAEAKEQEQLRWNRCKVSGSGPRSHGCCWFWGLAPTTFSTEDSKKERNFYLPAVPQWSTEKENQIIRVKVALAIRVGLLKAKSSQRPLSLLPTPSFLKWLFCALVRVTTGQRLIGWERRKKSFPKGIASLQKLWRNETSDPQHPSVLCDWVFPHVLKESISILWCRLLFSC